MTSSPVARTGVRDVVLVVTVTVAASTALTLLGVPSAVLFGALVGGMAQALSRPAPLLLPAPLFRVGQGLIGVTIGTLVSVPALQAMADDAPVIAAVTAGTVVVSLVAGRVLALRRDVSRTTGAFALIAGGASGVVALARDLGADERVVTVVQYVRVLVVLVTLPAVVALAFAGDGGAARDRTVVEAAWWVELGYVAVSLVLGLLLARLARFPTAVLLGPMLVAAVLAGSGWLVDAGLAPDAGPGAVTGSLAVPAPVQWVAYALIGVQVGLRFTRSSLAAITRMLPAVLAIIAAMLVVTGLMGALLALLTPVDGLTAYLATTPGGLFAVLATAADAGADVTYVMAVQLARLLVILAIIPLMARRLRRLDQQGPDDPDAPAGPAAA